jgi:hypothetical protein
MVRYWLLVFSLETKLENKLVVSLSCRLGIARDTKVSIKKNQLWTINKWGVHVSVLRVCRFALFLLLSLLYDGVMLLRWWRNKSKQTVWPTILLQGNNFPAFHIYIVTVLPLSWQQAAAISRTITVLWVLIIATITLAYNTTHVTENIVHSLLR